MNDGNAAPRRKRAARANAKGPTTPDAVEIAMEFLRDDTSVESPARALLLEQQKLVRAQRLSEAMGAGLKLLTGLVAVAAALGAAAMVWDASQERGLVIQAFNVPPALAQKGMTGEVLAGQLEDHLSRLEASTDSARAQATYTNDWGRDIEVEIPQTGVSISELQRYLRQWLGRQTRVGGDLYETPAGLKLTVRTGSEPGSVVTGSEAELDRMILEGAEALFARTQPYRYGVYLAQNGRQAESRAAMERLAATGPVEERAWATMGIGLASASDEESLRYMRQAAAIDPNLALAWLNIATGEQTLGRTDAALVAFERAETTLRRRDRGGMSARAVAPSTSIIRTGIAHLKGDLATTLQAVEATRRVSSYFGSREVAELLIPQFLAELHDVAAARAATPGPDDGTLTAELAKWNAFARPNYAIAVALDDWDGALAQLRAVEKVLTGTGFRPGEGPSVVLDRVLRPQTAEALARTGAIAEAQALLSDAPLDCDLCTQSRGVVAALAGRPADADRWFAAASAQNPRTSRAAFHWAQAKLSRNDLSGAADLARQAIAQAPDWADPHELLGAILVAQGDLKGAVASYTKATAIAPKWGRAHLKLGDALAAQGKREAAREAWRTAAGLGLSAADRAALSARKP